MKSRRKRNKVHDIASLFGGMVKTKKCRTSRSSTKTNNDTNDIMRTMQRLKRIDKPSKLDQQTEPEFLKTKRKLKSIDRIREPDVEAISTNVDIEGVEGETSQIRTQSVENNNQTQFGIMTNETQPSLNACEQEAFTKGMEYVRQLLLKEKSSKSQNGRVSAKVIKHAAEKKEENLEKHGDMNDDCNAAEKKEENLEKHGDMNDDCNA
eukprot:1027792_1